MRSEAGYIFRRPSHGLCYLSTLILRTLRVLSILFEGFVSSLSTLSPNHVNMSPTPPPSTAGPSTSTNTNMSMSRNRSSSRGTRRARDPYKIRAHFVSLDDIPLEGDEVMYMTDPCPRSLKVGEEEDAWKRMLEMQDYAAKVSHFARPRQVERLRTVGFIRHMVPHQTLPQPTSSALDLSTGSATQVKGSKAAGKKRVRMVKAKVEVEEGEGVIPPTPEYVAMVHGHSEQEEEEEGESEQETDEDDPAEGHIYIGRGQMVN
ncbi:hypothetical protein CVT24_000819 [Panaeolus cyanescens]|uniref:Uncharacterized protein n=1 Tax=Panaeolus cyanescens TaxID=181874 RepID=A0A409YCV0_9AGAR|nr:hypothetical protein CVT24_000819 [Panaeolus cyanescens]